MKQHITEKQLEEYRVSNVSGHYKLKDIMFHGDSPINMAEKLTIGKMIEMLGSKFDSLYLNHKNEFDVMVEEKNTEWCNRFENKELCDALWEAVKSVL